VISDQATTLFSKHPLDTLPLIVLFLCAIAALLLATELGYRLSRVMQRRWPDRAEVSVGALSGGTMALLAFLMAFVVSSSVNSFSARREAVVAEANAIGTTYLRAGYLPEPYSQEARELLREYVDLRLEALDPDKLPLAMVRSEEIHNELWAGVEALAKQESSPILALYISTVNEVIDMHTSRVNVALVARLPWNIVLGLFLMAVIALVQVGIHAGYAEKRNLMAVLAFVLTLSVVFILIIDLGRGDEGLLRISQQAMIDLQRQISP
jgi:hypothetical protein